MEFYFIWFYDYIRIINSSAIRNIKNISLLVAFGCIVATIVVLASPVSQSLNTTSPANGGGGCYDKKLQNEQAKKNYILRRLISYYEPPVKSL